MKIRTTEINDVTLAPLTARCPHCGNTAVLLQIGKDLGVAVNVYCGQRVCPNPSCKGHIFIVTSGSKILAAYPPLRIDFDTTNIPEAVRRTFEEAITCHANECFVAAAIMVRRTLEDLCSDQGAKGGTLYSRLKALSEKVVLPKELIDGLDDLRLLGNDAAHVEAITFTEVSRTELDVAIEFTKELLKALYQYSALLGRMRALRKSGG
jgi:hypothetical protein